MLSESSLLTSVQGKTMGSPLISQDVLCLPLEQPRSYPGVDPGPDGELLLQPALLLRLSLVKYLLRGLQRLLINHSSSDLQ